MSAGRRSIGKRRSARDRRARGREETKARVRLHFDYLRESGSDDNDDDDDDDRREEEHLIPSDDADTYSDDDDIRMGGGSRSRRAIERMPRMNCEAEDPGLIAERLAAWDERCHFHATMAGLDDAQQGLGRMLALSETGRRIMREAGFKTLRDYDRRCPDLAIAEDGYKPEEHNGQPYPPKLTIEKVKEMRKKGEYPLCDAIMYFLNRDLRQDDRVGRSVRGARARTKRRIMGYRLADDAPLSKVDPTDLVTRIDRQLEYFAKAYKEALEEEWSKEISLVYADIFHPIIREELVFGSTHKAGDCETWEQLKTTVTAFWTDLKKQPVWRMMRAQSRDAERQEKRAKQTAEKERRRRRQMLAAKKKKKLAAGKTVAAVKLGKEQHSDAADPEAEGVTTLVAALAAGQQSMTAGINELTASFVQVRDQQIRMSAAISDEATKNDTRYGQLLERMAAVERKAPGQETRKNNNFMVCSMCGQRCAHGRGLAAGAPNCPKVREAGGSAVLFDSQRREYYHIGTGKIVQSGPKAVKANKHIHAGSSRAGQQLQQLEGDGT